MATKRASAGQKTPDTCELREKILQASVELIEEEGLAKLSMREVARRAGCTHQAPYHHFEDREAILGEIAADGFMLLTEQVDRSVCSLGETASPAARIRAMGRAYVDFACQQPAHFRIMFRPELVDMERCPRARSEGDKAYAKFTGIVHAAVEAGLPAVPSEAALSAMLWSLSHGLAGLILDGPLARKRPDKDPTQVIDDVLSALEAMLENVLHCAGQPRREELRDASKP